jgi:hypothetical protein
VNPRYDAAYGLLLLALPAAVVVGLGVPLDPAVLLAEPDVLWPALSLLAMAVGGLFGLVAWRRPEGRIAGRRVDFLTFRGAASLSLGLSMSILAAVDLAAGELFGLVMLATAAFMGLVGVGTMLRRPSFAPEARGA